MIHAFIAFICCVIILLLRFPTWMYSWPAVFYISREFAQAEYRYVLKHLQGSFREMPTFAGFYPEVWNKKSLLDWICPLIVCVLFLFFAKKIKKFFISK